MEEFVDSEVLEAVRQRIAMVKIERTAKVEELKEIAVTVEGERARMAERDREEKKEKARQRKEEQEEQARQRKEEQEEQARQRKKQEQQRKEEAQRKEVQEKQQRKDFVQREEEQLEQARQRKKEQEEQTPKARGKYKTFDDQMEDLKRFKEMQGHANVSIREDKSLGQFCNKTRHTRKNPGNGKQLTDERIAAIDALGFNWMSKEYITKSFDERIEDLKEYKRMHGHLRVKRNENNSLYQFCAVVRYSLKVEKDGTRKLTVERITRLDALGFEWTTPH
jgi:hypothetical protein